MTGENTTVRPVRLGLARVWSTGLLDAAELVKIAQQPGDRLWQSSKSDVERVDNWVVKRSRLQGGVGPVRLTAQRERYRRPWTAGRHLETHGVAVPPIAGYIEWRFAGAIWANALVTRYLDGFRNLRDYIEQESPWTETNMNAFLHRLSKAVDDVSKAGAYHSDLADKNVLTQNGTEFYFVDLDAVTIGGKQTREQRLRNVVQLSDTFHDLWPADRCEELARLLCPNSNDTTWVQDVKDGLQQRIDRRNAIFGRPRTAGHRE